MLVQEKDQQGKKVNNYQVWTDEFYLLMKKKWGKRLRWVKANPKTKYVTTYTHERK